MTAPSIDKDFADKFIHSVNRPLEYGVYFLFHDWWAEAPQSAIDAYLEQMRALPGAKEVLAERFLGDPIPLERLAQCAPGTLGHGYHKFIVDNKLEENLGRNYKKFNEELTSSGKLDRLPDDMSFMMVRGFQIHDIMHVLTGYDATYAGELAVAAFYLAQLQFPYHAMRLAVTTAHMAYLDPKIITWAMDAICDGWQFGRSSPNIQFERWEDEIDTPLVDLRRKWNLNTEALAA
eukprot:s1_g1711.t1